MDETEASPVDQEVTEAGVAKLPGNTPRAKARPFVAVGSLGLLGVLIPAALNLNAMHPELVGTTSMLSFAVAFVSFSIAAVIVAVESSNEGSE